MRLESGDLLFESWRDPAAMAQITCGYALKLGADQIRIVGCGEYIWVRLEAGRELATLLFRHPLAAPQVKRTLALGNIPPPAWSRAKSVPPSRYNKTISSASAAADRFILLQPV